MGKLYFWDQHVHTIFFNGKWNYCNKFCLLHALLLKCLYKNTVTISHLHVIFAIHFFPRFHDDHYFRLVFKFVNDRQNIFSESKSL